MANASLALFTTKAQFACGLMSKNPGMEELAHATGDHPILEAFIALFEQFAPVLMKCFTTPAAAAVGMQHPREQHSLLLRLGIRRQLGDRQTFRMYGAAMEAAMIDTAKTTTKSEYAEVYAALQE